MKKGERIYYLDVLRVIACLCVIMIHASSSYAVKNIGSFDFWVGNLLDGVSQIGVPLFVMISGALMLDKDYEFSFLKLKKHILKMIAFFIFWSLLYCLVFNILFPVIVEHEALRYKEIFVAFFKGFYHLWFVYLIIGLYIIVPLLRLWVKDENRKYVEYFLVLSLVFAFALPKIVDIGANFDGIFEKFGRILENDLRIKYVGGFTAYFILGWYLNNYDLKNKKAVYCLGLLGAAVTVFGTYIVSAASGKSITLYGNLSLNVLIQTTAVFVFVKDRYSAKTKGNAIIKSISRYSLGIYAVHAAIIAIFYNVFRRIGFDTALIVVPLVFAVALIVSFVTSALLSKVPFLKKFVC